MKIDFKGIGDFSFLKIGQKLEKIPFRGVAGKAMDVIKSFLP